MILPVSEPKREIPSKKVIYTVNIGDYDAFRLHSFVNDDWDYIYFTDNIDLIRAEKIGNWKIYPVKYHQDNDTLTNRFYKIHPHRVLPEIYEESIYCDANADIRSNFIFEQIKKLNKNILLPIHHDRECIYKEIEAVTDIGKENFAKAMRLKQYLKNQKFPKNYGLTENNIIYRHHNDERIKKIMEEWYYMLKTYCYRDQLSLMYLFWKNGLKPQDYMISNIRANEENFGLYSHLKFH